MKKVNLDKIFAKKDIKVEPVEKDKLIDCLQKELKRIMELNKDVIKLNGDNKRFKDEIDRLMHLQLENNRLKNLYICEYDRPVLNFCPKCGFELSALEYKEDDF